MVRPAPLAVVPNRALNRVRGAALLLPDQTRARAKPEKTLSRESGEPPPRPLAVSDPRRCQRRPIHPKPSDLDQTVQIRFNRSQIDPYRSTRALLHLSPSIFPKSTRTPVQFKSISILIQFLSKNPLTVCKIGPTIHTLVFGMLALLFLYEMF